MSIRSTIIDKAVIDSTTADKVTTMSCNQSLEIALVANFFAEGIRESLDYWMNTLDIRYRLSFAPSEQVMQYLLNKDLFSTNRIDVLLLLLQVERWGSPAVAGSHLQSLSMTLNDISRRIPALHIIVLFGMPSPQRITDDKLQDLELTFAANTPVVDVVRSATTAQLYPVDAYFDAYMNQQAQIPYTRLYLSALATVIARRISLLNRKDKKLIILDADNTLWSGIAAERDGSTIRVDELRIILQRFMLNQRNEGRLLALCSKNLEADVLDIIDNNQDMQLRRQHFAAIRANWNSKADNIVSISSELSLALDSVIFLDDNPSECADVQNRLPQVITLLLPSTLEHIEQFLNSIWEFDIGTRTREDNKRACFYMDDAKRKIEEIRAPTLEEFLGELRLIVEITPMSSESLARASQLLRRTTQFNLNSAYISETDLYARIQAEDAHIFKVSARDRFGEYGMIGLFYYRLHESCVEVEIFLLSCRALGKRIEHRMVLWLAQIAEDAGKAQLSFAFVPTARNRPLMIFLEELEVRFSQDNTGIVSTARARRICSHALQPYTTHT